jgi:hypothetical protein
VPSDSPGTIRHYLGLVYTSSTCAGHHRAYFLYGETSPTDADHARFILMELTVIGIDFAVDARKVGLALGSFADGAVTVEEVRLGSKKPSLVDVIDGWLSAHPGQVALLALDAPLGWPEPLGRVLADHRAGHAISTTANEMFRRYTDDYVCKHTGQRPHDVGADRIDPPAGGRARFQVAIRTGCGDSAVILPYSTTTRPQRMSCLMCTKS